MDDRFLSSDEQRQLLALARRAFEARVRGDASGGDERCDMAVVAGGVFVTIHRRGELRGCLGRLEPLPVPRLVAELARSVADSDPRFDAVVSSELPEIDIEISILTGEQEIASPAEIEIGRHGVLVAKGVHRGLLLPQVATEHGWDRLTFLEHACLKAGLHRDAWRQGARLYVFEALVFGEAAARGPKTN